MRRALAILVLLTATASAEDPRFAPTAVRDKAVGCWRLAKDQQLVITAFGRHSIKAHLAGAVTTTEALAPWRAADKAFALACRQPKNADYRCLAVPDGDTLHVRVFQREGKGGEELQVDDIRAPRC